MTWIDVPDESPFPIQNLPYGVFRRGASTSVGVAIGDHLVDVRPLAEEDRVEWAPAFAATDLTPFLASGRPAWQAARAWLNDRLTDAASRNLVARHLIPRSDVEMVLPFQVADYVDFYSSEHHATNVGRLFRPDQPALTPNWRHLPVGYHGRAGTVSVSGTPVIRPCGQRMPVGAQSPTFGPSTRLDIEAEVGFVVGVPTTLGEAVPIGRFAEHVFGACLVNDWSARDIQAWEYVPLGPFLGKSFLTSVSPWIVPLEALDAARIVPPARDPAPLPYLRDVESDPWGLDLLLEIQLNGAVISRPPFAAMYWTPAQQLAHLTINGASLRTGDLFASGTVSGPQPHQRGSLLELAWGGAEPIVLPDGTTRTFLEDGDEVVISCTAPGADGARIGFGDVRGRVEPARRSDVV